MWLGADFLKANLLVGRKIQPQNCCALKCTKARNKLKKNEEKTIKARSAVLRSKKKVCTDFVGTCVPASPALKKIFK